MIASLTGTLQYIAPDRCVLDVGGVGYEVFLSNEGLSRLPEKGGELFLHIHTSVREDAIVLYGFTEAAEKEMFLTLKTVSGIGPKLALGMLSGMQVNNLCHAISSEDVTGLTTIQGVGKKTAERICVELKDKVGGMQTAPATGALPSLADGSSALNDALSALVNLGYPDSMAREAMVRVKKELGSETFANLAVEELIKEGLRAIV